jgi:mannose-1-phosphate guanylyltransferase
MFPEIGIILAGGFGTRLSPLTDHTPKPLLMLGNKPIVQYTIDLMKKFGVKKIYLSVGHKADQIKEYFGNGEKIGIEIDYLVETEPLGTAGPLKLAKERNILNKTFFMSNGDEIRDINLHEMYDSHKNNNATATIALTKVDDPSTFGVANLEGSKILEFVEKPKLEDAPSNFISSGFYCLEPEILNFLPEKQKVSIEKDIWPNVAKAGKQFGFHFPGYFSDTGTFERLDKVKRHLAEGKFQ